MLSMLLAVTGDSIFHLKLISKMHMPALAGLAPLSSLVESINTMDLSTLSAQGRRRFKTTSAPSGDARHPSCTTCRVQSA